MASSSSASFPLALYCASHLPPLSYTGTEVRPCTTSGSAPRVKKNAVTPSPLKSIIRLPVSDFIGRVQNFNAIIPDVDLAGRSDLPLPSLGPRQSSGLRTPALRNSNRSLHPLKTAMQISVASDVGDILHQSLLPTTHTLLNTIYQHREPTTLNGQLSPENCHWRRVPEVYFDPKFRVDGGYGVPIAPSLQTFIWEPKEAEGAPKAQPIRSSPRKRSTRKGKAKGKGKAKEESPLPDADPIPPPPRLLLAVSPRWSFTTRTFKEGVTTRALSTSTSPSQPFGPTRSEMADTILSKITDQCINDRIRHIVITSHDLWTFGSFSADFSQLHLTPPIPLTSTTPEHAPPTRHRETSSQRSADDSNHLAEEGVKRAPVSVMQSLLYMMESVLRFTEDGGTDAWSAAMPVPIPAEDAEPPTSTASVPVEGEAGPSNPACPSTPAGPSQQLRKRKRELALTRSNSNLRTEVTITVSMAATTYEGSNAAQEDDTSLPPGHFKRLRRSGPPIVGDALAAFLNTVPALQPTFPNPPPPLARQPTPPQPTASFYSPPPYSPPSRSPSPVTHQSSQVDRYLGTPPSSDCEPPMAPKASQSGISSTIPQSSIGTSRHSQGFAARSKDKYARAAESLRQRQIRDAGKSKRWPRGDHSDIMEGSE